MATWPELELDRQVCFRVYHLHRLITERYRPLLDELGLTYPQYLCLLVLWEGDGITVGELGKRLDLDTGTLSPLLKRLEARGLLLRQRQSSDERVVRLVLTGAGQELKDRARLVPGALLSCLGEATDFAAGEIFIQVLDAALASLQDDCGGSARNEVSRS